MTARCWETENKINRLNVTQFLIVVVLMLTEQSFYIKIALYGRIVPKKGFLIQYSLKVDINSVIHVLRCGIISGSKLPQF